MLFLQTFVCKAVTVFESKNTASALEKKKNQYGGFGERTILELGMNMNNYNIYRICKMFQSNRRIFA